MPDYALYKVGVKILTPVHIGNGSTLANNFDYAIHDGRTWRLNEGAILEAYDAEDPVIIQRLLETPPGRLLQRSDFREDSPLFRYVIKGTPRSSATGAQVLEQIKDAHDRPFLPGSSLKGALRTALAWYMWDQLGWKPDRSRLGRNPRFAAQRYERDIFGSDPNHDFLRALHVGDSAPGKKGNDLMIVNGRVFHRGGRLASPIEMEALRPGVVFTLEAKVDRALYSDWAQSHGLELGGKQLLEALPRVVQAHTQERLQAELDWFSHARESGRTADFYRRLRETRVLPTTCVLQMGWGTGWEDKTFGSHLQADSSFMESILRHPSQGGYGLARGRRQPDDRFPKSRSVLVNVQRGSGGRVAEQPLVTPGWVLLEFVLIEHSEQQPPEWEDA